MPARYCRAFTSRYPFEAGASLVYTAVARNAERLSTENAALLHFCSQFQTIEQHLAGWRKNGGDSQPRLAASLNGYAEAGLLLSDQQFIAHCKSAAAPESAPPAIAAIGTTTRNRPQLLQRGLASFIANANTFGRALDIVVIDDGISTQEQSATRQVLKALAHERGATVRYADREQRRRFADELASAAGLPPETLRFALLGDETSTITTGAARNSLLIDSVGDLLLLVDDDSVCRVARCPRQEPGLALDARTNPTELWFYPDRDTMLGATQFAEQDPLSAHETILGRQVSDCLPPPEQVAGLDLQYATADFAERLWRHGGRVLATSAGVVGDSGMGSTAYLALPPDSQARLVGSEQDYTAAVINRQILRAPHRTTITRGTFCAGASLGLDNRVLLPPFIPIQRNSDGLFARTLLRCFRDAYKGYLPWAVLHDPLPPRAQSLEGAQADAARIRLTHILRSLIAPAAFPQSGDPARDLRRLGDELVQVASLRPADFQHAIKAGLVKAAALYLDSMERAAKAAPGPEFYKRRQEAHSRQLSEAITTAEYFTPRDLAGAPEQAGHAAQRVVLQFGQTLRAWPAIVAAARNLRSRGVRLATAI
jgi:hypothetical protein